MSQTNQQNYQIKEVFQKLKAARKVEVRRKVEEVMERKRMEQELGVSIGELNELS